MSAALALLCRILPNRKTSQTPSSGSSCNHELARSMGEAGMLAVRERFNWQIERAKLLGLYQEILG